MSSFGVISTPPYNYLDHLAYSLYELIRGDLKPNL
jgi:hypothetical protein